MEEPSRRLSRQRPPFDRRFFPIRALWLFGAASYLPVKNSAPKSLIFFVPAVRLLAEWTIFPWRDRMCRTRRVCVIVHPRAMHGSTTSARAQSVRSCSKCCSPMATSSGRTGCGGSLRYSRTSPWLKSWRRRRRLGRRRVGDSDDPVGPPTRPRLSYRYEGRGNQRALPDLTAPCC